MIQQNCFQRGFVDQLMASNSFRRWYLLGVDVPERMVWLDQLHSVNENAFDAICCKILRSIYGMMEKSMTSDKDLSFATR
mmetsp:Transcript_26258/g.55854  ORF Transcript_26258/g.55854 Transcript_26258/m.55854 type:complete len:80 (+) Transcript_26258:232-471(+)